ncbi:MAG: D-sedoheptulose-7-phosphate isomerase [Candidatus Humimicrobiaceae bacterium]
MKEFIHDYINSINIIMAGLDIEKISEVIVKIGEAHKNKKRIFVIGNGGSAATTNHFVCDLGKNAIKDDENRFQIISLSNSVSCITAYGNDVGYESIFAEQLKNLMQMEDIIICISASGNSPNIIKAVEYAKKKNGIIISLTGFKGGRLKEISDFNVNVPSDSYEKIEDAHLIITHIIVYWFKMNLNS